jgi:hypothetical protein
MIFALSLFLLAIDIGVIYVHREEWRLLYINARAGCYPWSPAEVEFHEGMTICPGQRARGRIIIIPPTGRPGI